MTNINSFDKISKTTEDGDIKMKRLIEMFDEIIDVRDSRGKLHCATHIMVMATCGILNKCMDFEDIYDYAKSKEKYFNKKLNLWNGIPCSATFRNVFRVIPAESFLTVFMNWIKEIVEKQTGKQIIIDGKAIRGATEKCTNGNIPYIVSAYLADIGISIGQVKVDDKSNEISAIPELLKILDIDGCIITIDAIGTQTQIMDMIVDKGADFVLPVKMNNKGANKETIDFFKDSIEEDFKELTKSKKKEELLDYINKHGEKFEVYITRENTHGREEERIYIKSNNTKWLKNKKWKHVKSIVMAINNTTIHDNSVRYYFSSTDIPVKDLAKIIRKHWQIENNLHWVLDMYFYEDLSRNRKDNAMENLSILKKLCYNIIKLDTRYDKINKNGNLIKLSTKRKMNRYVNYPDEFEELLCKIIPQIYFK